MRYQILSWQNKILSTLGIACPKLPVRENYDYPPDVLYSCNNVAMYLIENIWLALGDDGDDLGHMEHGNNMRDNEHGYNQVNGWFNEIENLNITMLILNRGSHYKIDKNFVPEVNRTLEAVYTRYPHVKKIWRNTPHGRHDHQFGAGRSSLVQSCLD